MMSRKRHDTGSVWVVWVIALSILSIIVGLVMYHLKHPNDPQTSADALFSDHGTLYVRHDNQWYNPPNLTSARLILGAAMNPQPLGGTALPHKDHIIALAGIPHAPEIHPFQPTSGSVWDICSIPTSPDNPTPMTSIIAGSIGQNPSFIKEPDDAHMVVKTMREDQTNLWLLDMRTGNHHLITIPETGVPENLHNAIDTAIEVTPDLMAMTTASAPMDAGDVPVDSLVEFDPVEQSVCLHHVSYNTMGTSSNQWGLTSVDQARGLNGKIVTNKTGSRLFTTPLSKVQGWFVASGEPTVYHYVNADGVAYGIGGNDRHLDKDFLALGLDGAAAQTLPDGVINLFTPGVMLSKAAAMTGK